MRVLGSKTLKAFWERFPASELALKAWFYEARHAVWKSADDVKALYRDVAIAGGKRAVFHLGNDAYRLAATTDYAARLVLVRSVSERRENNVIDLGPV